MGVGPQRPGGSARVHEPADDDETVPRLRGASPRVRDSVQRPPARVDPAGAAARVPGLSRGVPRVEPAVADGDGRRGLARRPRTCPACRPVARLPDRRASPGGQSVSTADEPGAVESRAAAVARRCVGRRAKRPRLLAGVLLAVRPRSSSFRDCSPSTFSCGGAGQFSSQAPSLSSS